jgi:signal transduction histidine kinase
VLLRRRAEPGPGELAAQLASVQELLRAEVLALRELIQDLRPLEIETGQLEGYLADLVERLGRETGITARFTGSDGAVAMPRRACADVVGIVREALINIRKHSPSTRAAVTLGARAQEWVLAIEDNGYGFPFSGRLEDVQVDRSLRTPAILRDRVRALGGWPSWRRARVPGSASPRASPRCCRSSPPAARTATSPRSSTPQRK